MIYCREAMGRDAASQIQLEVWIVVDLYTPYGHKTCLGMKAPDGKCVYWGWSKN